MQNFAVKSLAASLFLTFAGFANQASADHAWGNYHWARTANPFTLKLGDNVSPAWDSYLATTSSDWSESTVLNTAIVAGATTPRKCRATSGQVEVCSERYGNNGWLGLASIWASGSHIVQGTTKLNDTYFNTAKYNTEAWRNLVMCQEVGHTLGLDHQDENFSNSNLGTCMDYTNIPGTNQHPNAHDYAQLETIYKHLDSANTFAQSVQSTAEMPRHIAEHDAEDPSAWGKLIRSSKNGLKEVYMLDFGRGYRIFRFVIWAEGEGRGRERR
jgi:hypothetical protein